MGESLRVDVWVWAVRCTKTRSAATAACRAGHVRVNGQPAKAAQALKVGDEVRVRLHGFDRILVVRQLLLKRVGAELAAQAFEDRTPARPTPMETQLVPIRDRGTGRPTKRDRREIDRLRGR